MRQAVIFDLDGTLTQSEEGIWNCVRYAADRMGYPHPDGDTLRKFIGPPLMYSFQTYMGMDEDKAREAVARYRERYTTVGLYENRVFPASAACCAPCAGRAGMWPSPPASRRRPPSR